MYLAVDSGGTFTDVVVETDDGVRRIFKAPTTPADPAQGVINACAGAASALGMSLYNLLNQTRVLIHGTTHALNAVITGQTARTAFLTTRGHPDILVLREGGRSRPFDYRVPYPNPYVPRSLTFEITGRILPDGTEYEAFDPKIAHEVADRLIELKIESIAVCLLWSVVNSSHEEALGRILSDRLPDIPMTLSHRLNPTLREFRRASSTAVDASLKPIMTEYMSGLEARLCDAGFAGRLLIVTSRAGLIEAIDAAAAPIHIVNSGPSMAPVAGRYFAAIDGDVDDVIVTDAGGTTFDVSLVRRGRIPNTREPWIGQPYTGVMIGFPWVDVKSIGAGGGSIAWIDKGGLLHVGPRSAGAVPGPAAYDRGGTEPTVTDAAVTLGHIDPKLFLGGALPLNRSKAEDSVRRKVAEPLGLIVESAAAAILSLATERMAGAIAEIATAQGLDIERAIIVGGGGAAGLNIARIAARLGCPRVLLPQEGAALSAVGALLSDIKSGASAVLLASTANFDADRINATLRQLEMSCRAFAARVGVSTRDSQIEYRAQARYATQVWEIDVILPRSRVDGPEGFAAFVEAFHRSHEDLFGYRDPSSSIEISEWFAEISCPLRAQTAPAAPPSPKVGRSGHRRAYFDDIGWIEAPVFRFDRLPKETDVFGPALVESELTTLVIPPGARVRRHHSGSLALTVGRAT